MTPGHKKTSSLVCGFCLGSSMKLRHSVLTSSPATHWKNVKRQKLLGFFQAFINSQFYHKPKGHNSTSNAQFKAHICLAHQKAVGRAYRLLYMLQTNSFCKLQNCSACKGFQDPFWFSPIQKHHGKNTWLTSIQKSMLMLAQMHLTRSCREASLGAMWHCHESLMSECFSI